MLRKLALAFAIGAFAAFGTGVLAQTGLGITGTESQWRNSIFQVGILRITRGETLTAYSGGGQTNATQLVYGLNQVTTVAADNDSAKLPICQGGKVVVVINAGANSLNLFGQTGETINALSANAAYAVASTKIATAFCGADGKWYASVGS